MRTQVAPLAWILYATEVIERESQRRAKQSQINVDDNYIYNTRYNVASIDDRVYILICIIDVYIYIL